MRSPISSVVSSPSYAKALAYEGEETTLEIGDRTVIREGVTIHRGMEDGGIGSTIIGCDCLLMAYVHVGHDCVVGDHVIMANNASLSGLTKTRCLP